MSSRAVNYLVATFQLHDVEFSILLIKGLQDRLLTSDEELPLNFNVASFLELPTDYERLFNCTSALLL